LENTLQHIVVTGSGLLEILVTRRGLAGTISVQTRTTTIKGRRQPLDRCQSVLDLGPVLVHRLLPTYILECVIAKEVLNIGFQIGFSTSIDCRVARWYIFEPKTPTWVNFGGSCNGRCWYILWPFGPLHMGYLVHFVATWYNLWYFGLFFPVLVCCTKKNLATLIGWLARGYSAAGKRRLCNVVVASSQTSL
jgi:hypothetical protein